MVMQESSSSKKGWPVGRALRTFLSFNGPRFLSGRRKKKTSGGVGIATATTVTPQFGADLPVGHGIVLVTGATGGVGRRVVSLLLEKGIRVRALARNEQKALAMLNGGQKPEPGALLEIVNADIRDPAALTPELMEGVTAVIGCTAAIVQPKSGDSEDRAKYYQGIVFYEPETLDSPEETDFVGVKNVLAAANKYADVKGCKKLYNCAPAFIDRWQDFASLDDVVMGGTSDSKFTLIPGAGEAGNEDSPSRIAGVFEGMVTTERGFASGGFTSVRTRNLEPPLDLTGYEGLRLRVLGDGNTYKIILRDSDQWDGPSWSTMVPTQAGKWADLDVPFTSLIPVARTRSIPADQRQAFRLDQIFAIQIMLSKFAYDGEVNPTYKDGPFKLVIQSIEAYMGPSAPRTSRFVHISSAGVERPGRPGIVLEEEPPAVRMNDMLGGILTYKLKGEEAIRASGLPYTIIRPCALTEEPANMPLEVDVGDTIKGKVSRDDVARLAVYALACPEATNLTFEVKSSLAFSQQWTAEDAARAPVTDMTQVFAQVKSMSQK
ncbi:hypothetical protein NSK_000689 [Nannochloropsis salina CCMP1776]|uniref:NADH:ubiquinone oxidoreductase intermediate-associated protein 30 domain-containing protein n=1 Tax=Nannochloropsis salina CCMP1776 TaxID=1027361 RepID=A0A4D9DA79_9STRA|nr:hypothetical protein NSK_000689 [Nannochloropsis salina CCMP1776]|eukprot:TFJ88340.1 hypothetical protein NSK_000689 [Nannochloropsis salina CCMP1776]